MEIFVTLETQDAVARKIHKQIEKTYLLVLWLNKAIALIDAYERTLEVLSNEKDQVAMGRLIQDCESYSISAVGFFARCFHEQEGFRLNIKEVTQDSRLLSAYEELMTLRNDEFVHWKGIRTQFTIRYSFQSVDPKTIEFGRAVEGSYEETVGISDNFAITRGLLTACIAHIEARRKDMLSALRKHFQTTDALFKSELRDINGKSVLRKIGQR